MTRIAVMVKQVPDTSLIEIDENGNLRRDGVPSMLDPFSFFALKMAVKLKNEIGGTVTAVTMGPMQAKDALMRCLEYGADDAVLLNDKDFAGSDTWATARVLSEFVKKESGFDYIFCGMQATDGDTGQVPAEISVLLDAELISYATELSINDGVEIEQNYDGDIRKVKAHVPAVISVSRGALITEGLPSIDDYICARTKTITVRNRIFVGLGAYSAGSKGSFTTVIRSASPMPVKKKTKVFDGSDPTSAAKELLEVLK